MGESGQSEQRVDTYAMPGYYNLFVFYAACGFAVKYGVSMR